MLRNKPKCRYSGLTIILSNPSRFDTISLLNANGGILMNEALQPEINLMMTDVRLADDPSPFIEGTKCLLLLGEYSMHKFCSKDSENNTLNELRGSVFDYNGIPVIASYFPQDCVDFRNYEQTLNENSKEYSNDSEVSSDSLEESEGDVKRFSPTKRSNYAFWLKADIEKCKAIISQTYKFRIHHRRVADNKARFVLFPPADEVIAALTSVKNGTLYFDMETDYEEQNLLCFSFSWDGRTVYCVPILDYNYRPAYTAYHFIMRALAVAIRDNTIVAHNGQCFDFFVLGYKYRIPVYRCYDTMMAMHRCFPTVEKSLGHCTSYWTWERFHKDSDSQAYFTHEHMIQKLKYCGKDVFTMYLVKEAIDQYAQTIPGLSDSIKCANDSIVPYLLMSLQGIAYDEEARAKIVRSNDRLMMQYIRIMNCLIGPQGLAEIKQQIKGFKGSFVGSSKQATTYFHNLLEYPVLWRNPDSGNPSLGAKLMYRLAMKYPDNPMIPLILAYRKVAKETGSLKFIPWKDDKGEVYKAPIEQERLF